MTLEALQTIWRAASALEAYGALYVNNEALVIHEYEGMTCVWFK